MIRALETSSEIENIAWKETAHIPRADEFARAQALYGWMRSSIAYDTEKYDQIIDRTFVGPYFNSVETLYYKRGVCAEQAFLYIVMARHAGLDARYVRNDQNPGHAVVRVHSHSGEFDIDTTKTDGCPWGGGWGFYEVPESHLDEMVNRNRLGQTHEHHRPYHRSHHSPHDHRWTPSQARAFIAALILATPWYLSQIFEMRLEMSRARPVLVSDPARKYVKAATEIACRRHGPDGETAIGLMKNRFDRDRDGVLDEGEAYALYKQVEEE